MSNQKIINWPEAKFIFCTTHCIYVYRNSRRLKQCIIFKIYVKFVKTSLVKTLSINFVLHCRLKFFTWEEEFLSWRSCRSVSKRTPYRCVCRSCGCWVSVTSQTSLHISHTCRTPSQSRCGALGHAKARPVCTSTQPEKSWNFVLHN